MNATIQIKGIPQKMRWDEREGESKHLANLFAELVGGDTQVVLKRIGDISKHKSSMLRTKGQEEYTQSGKK
jgi:hypothetical protein